jgi:ubiquinone/menaquinone biosynthesis C-methylase UbiE
MQQGHHGILPEVRHDERAREGFCTTMRDITVRMSRQDNAVVYEQRVAPKFRRGQGRLPKDRHEIRRAMLEDPYGQMGSALRLLDQELKYDAIGPCLERQLPDLVKRAKPEGTTLGSLTLDRKLAIPRYLSSVDIHCMPGSYYTEVVADDVYAGALYDRGFFIRAKGIVGPYMDDIGASHAAWLKETHPEFSPRRILDMGCSIGHSTLPYCDAFPDAEVHAIDVAAPMLRYGHARAESLGKRVHFAQRNAEATGFPDGHFDLVVGHAMLHETSTAACRNILKEGRRLLRPGGLLFHFEAPPWSHMSEFEASVHDWDTHFNAEPFIGKLHDLDARELILEAGFAPADFIEVYLPSLRNRQSKTSLGTVGANKHAGHYWFFGGRK